MPGHRAGEDGRVLILLPPSEGKTPPAGGPALDLAALSLPELGGARRTVLDALVTLCRTDPDGARQVLGLSPRQAEEVTRDAGLPEAATAPAWQVYTGVLFAALDPGGLPPAALDRLTAATLVWSGLWGAVGLGDPIPAYRLAGGVTLPGPGRLSTFWREPLSRAMATRAHDQLVLDLRSSTYAASWAGPPGRSVSVRVVQERAGARTVAGHFNKATKGRLLRALAVSGSAPTTPDELVDEVRALGFQIETGPHAPRSGRGGHCLDLVVDHL
jgi:cytoplasmic iron level regulating protein YaaA (DUF328/UPF0246 family)